MREYSVHFEISPTLCCEKLSLRLLKKSIRKFSFIYVFEIIDTDKTQPYRRTEEENGVLV